MHFGLISTYACVSSDLKQWLEEHSRMHHLVQRHLLRAQNKMKN